MTGTYHRRPLLYPYEHSRLTGLVGWRIRMENGKPRDCWALSQVAKHRRDERDFERPVSPFVKKEVRVFETS